MRRRGPQSGFTLVETLVSLAIATLAVTGFYRALSLGMFMESRADVQAEQMLVATQVMDRIGVDVPLRAGTQLTGNADGLDWSLVVSEGSTPDMNLGIIQPEELIFLYVSVESSREDGSPLVLRGIRYIETPL